MKTLLKTFGLVIALVAAALVYANYTSRESVKVAKSIIDKDSKGRTTQVVTLEQIDNQWVETSKDVYSYSDEAMQVVSYVKDGGSWNASKKVVNEMVEGVNVATISYAFNNGNWNKVSEVSLVDLSANNDIVEDLVFDANGNLIMKATYKWDSNGKGGLSKEEYEYAGGEQNKVVSYAWNGSDWHKSSVYDLVKR